MDSLNAKQLKPFNPLTINKIKPSSYMANFNINYKI